MEATRTATIADRAEYERLRDAFLAEAGAGRGGALAPDPGWRHPGGGGVVLGHLDAVLAGTTAVVELGTIDDVPTGFAQAHLEVAVTAAGTTRRAVLDACYVEPGARGVGLGRLLLDAMVDWARARGCDGVDGSALPGDRAAKNFFEAAGFKARILTMYRPLD